MRQLTRKCVLNVQSSRLKRKKFGLDLKKYPLVCKESSEQRRKLAMEKGLGAMRPKAAKQS